MGLTVGDGARGQTGNAVARLPPARLDLAAARRLAVFLATGVAVSLGGS
jgi:hypothetical protein